MFIKRSNICDGGTGKTKSHHCDLSSAPSQTVFRNTARGRWAHKQWSSPLQVWQRESAATGCTWKKNKSREPLVLKLNQRRSEMCLQLHLIVLWKFHTKFQMLNAYKKTLFHYSGCGLHSLRFKVILPRHILYNKASETINSQVSQHLSEWHWTIWWKKTDDFVSFAFICIFWK